jgi:hypothetical protein
LENKNAVKKPYYKFLGISFLYFDTCIFSKNWMKYSISGCFCQIYTSVCNSQNRSWRFFFHFVSEYKARTWQKKFSILCQWDQKVYCYNTEAVSYIFSKG